MNNIRLRLWASPRYPRWLLLNCLVGMFSTTFTATILTVSLARVARDLHSSPGVISWVITAPMLASAVAMPLLGRLGDVHGHRRVYLVGFGLAIAFSVLTTLARDPLWLIGSRSLAQLAGAATVPASFAMLFRSFPPEERVRASAWASGALSAASVTGLVVGGPIVDTIGWRPLFLIQAGLGALALLPAFFILRPDEARRRVPLDLPGAALLAGAVFCATFGLNRLMVSGSAALPAVLLALVAPLVGILVRVEKRAPSPLLPVTLVRNRQIPLVSTASLTFGGSWTGSFVITAILLEAVFHYSATTTSLISLCRTGSIMLAAPVAARLGSRYGERRILLGAGAAIVAGMLGLAVGTGVESIVIVVLALILSGWAWGHAQPALVAVTANAVDEKEFGLATSLQQTAGQVGAVMALGVVTAMAADATTRGPFVAVYLLTAGMALAGELASVLCRVPDKVSALGVTTDEIDAMAGAPVPLVSRR